MSKLIFALMFSSNEKLWEKYQKILGSKYLVMLLPIEVIEQSKQAIREKELIILDIPSDKEKWIKNIRAAREILGKRKPLLVISSLPRNRVSKILNAGADECLEKLESPKAVAAVVSNLIDRYRLE